MYKKILVPLDGSKRSEAVLPHVENLSKHEGTKIYLTRVVEPTTRELVFDPNVKPKIEFDSDNVQSVKDYLENVKKDFTDKGLDAETVFLRGLSVDGILYAAKELEADLIAMTGQGKTGLKEAIYGSTTMGVLQKFRRPLLLVHHETEVRTASNDRILVPLDGSKFSESIMPHAKNVAQLYDAKLTIVRVVMTAYRTTVVADSEKEFKEDSAFSNVFKKLEHEEEIKRVKEARKYLMKWHQKLSEEDLQVNTMLLHGPAIDGIIHAAKEIDADLIAMTTHGRTGLERIIYGGVAAGVLNRLRRPLLLIRPKHH